MRISYWSSDVCSADLRFEDLAAVGVDAAQFTFVTFPGAVPEVAIDPAHAGDETVRFDRAQDLAAVRIDLMNLALAVLAHPQRTLGPGHAGIAAATRCWNRRQNLAGFRIDLLDAFLGEIGRAHV